MGSRNRCLRVRLLTTTIIASVAFGAPAFAQEGERQVRSVAGAELAGAPSESTSPVTVIDGEEGMIRGLIRAEDLLNSLPQVYADQGAYISNGATGTADVDLRGLGSERTLALINGRRMAPGNPFLFSPDLNTIPLLMVDRVELTTGAGASKYGSGAVSGAVNFVLNTDFEGFRFDGQAGVYQHDNDGDRGLTEAFNRRGWTPPEGNTTDGESYNLNLAYGTSFDNDRGHLAVYAGYRRIEAVTHAERDYSACAAQARTPSQVAAEPARLVDCGGSVTSANGTIFAEDGGTSETFQIGPNRTLIAGVTPYNFAPVNYLQRPDERYTAGVFADYEFGAALRPYLELMFMDDSSESHIAPSGDFGNTLNINCGSPGAPQVNAPGIGNPLLSAQQRAILCDAENLIGADGRAVGQTGSPAATFIDPTTGLPYRRGGAQILRRNVEGGARVTELQHRSYRAVAGARGELGNSWSYDTYVQHSRTEFDGTYLNDMSVTRLERAIDIIDDPRTPGVDPICRSALNGTDTACVPWDVFAIGQVSDAALAYLQTPGVENGENSQTIISASITGNPGQWGLRSAWAKSDPVVTFGVEYRRDSLDFDANAVLSMLPSSDLAGHGVPTLPMSGSTDVREIFADLHMPLIEDGAVRKLSLDAGYRYSDQDFGSSDTYYVGAILVPVSGVSARASFGRSASAPNVRDLFAPQRVARNGNGDPCSGAAPFASLVSCQAMGVTAAQYGTIAPNPAGQYNGLIGGNPDLNPEVADTFTLGVTYQPSFVPNLTVSLDYFDIGIDDAISIVDQDAILDTCADTRDAFLCGLVQRDASGSLWQTQQGFVRALNQNVGSLSTSGFDVAASYALDLGAMGSVEVSMLGTRMESLEADNGLSAAADCAGYHGAFCGTPAPEWRHRVRLDYATPFGWDASLQWRYFGSVDTENRNSSPALNQIYAPFNAQIESQSYLDLALSTRFANAYTLRFGVNNLLDRSPPIFGTNGANVIINGCGASENSSAAACNGNTYPNIYDALGRYFFAGVTVDF